MARNAGAAVVIVAALVFAGCSTERARSGDSPPAHPQLVSLAARYLAIAEPATEELEDAFDGLEDGDEHDLVAARKDYRHAADTEREFDRALLAQRWPPAIAATARAMVRVNEARAALTVQAAAATTLDEVEALEPDLSLADQVVEHQVEIIRDQLGLPPPDTD